MLSTLHAGRWLLGGTFAAVAGLAASAEPLAPMPPAVIGGTQIHNIVPLRLTVTDPVLVSSDGATPAEVVPLAQVPVRISVQTGADVRPVSRDVFTAEARWDDRAQGDDWSVAATRALESAPHDLREFVPADIEHWCPAYDSNPRHLRAAFWVGTVSALARYESNFDPAAQGGGGLWHGLLQIAPATARHYGCDATSASELHDGEANLECAIRIMSRTVTRDGVVSAGDDGIAADWGPMSNDDLRAKMQAWVRDQSYCEVQTAVMASLRPVARPDEEPATRLALLDLDDVRLLSSDMDEPR